ncbi:MAG: 4Fe-4S binding protein [Armatimonadota bacterium]
MQWDEEAINALSFLSVSIQDAAQKEAEECANAKEHNCVTAADVDAAAQVLNVNSKSETSTEINGCKICDDKNNGKFIAVEHIERLESFSYETGTIKTDYSILRVCSASIGCPKRVMELGSLRDKLEAKIEEKGMKDFMNRNIGDIIPFHQRFKVALSGCPNTCSQPQICDFGVIARAMPECSLDTCTSCQMCVSTCLENSVEIMDGEPVIDYITCVGCSDCARACPTGALIAARKGFTIKIGGRLGRHPQLAQELVHLASEDEVVIAMDVCLDIYMDNARLNERFSYVVSRLGEEPFLQAVGEALGKYRHKCYSTKKKVYHAF